jgi:hypothetical protein
MTRRMGLVSGLLCMPVRVCGERLFGDLRKGIKCILLDTADTISFELCLKF